MAGQVDVDPASDGWIGAEDFDSAELSALCVAYVYATVIHGPCYIRPDMRFWT